jgi:NIMA (never in mitosis gene a)-related kinase
MISKVGEGAFASVYKVKRKEDGKIYAMKKIKIANSNSR